jgi:lipopolysaccharide/colanic/teichoic acid biosynthesis glycosyltransferase
MLIRRSVRAGAGSRRPATLEAFLISMSTELHEPQHTEDAQLRRDLATAALPVLPASRPRIVIADLVVLLGVMFASLPIRFGFTLDKPFLEYLAGFSLATVIHLTVSYFGGLYEAEPRLAARLWLPRVGVLTGIALLVVNTISLISGWFLIPRGNLPIVFVLVSIGLTTNRHVARRLRTRREGKARILVVGEPDEAEIAVEHLIRLERGTEIAGRTASVANLIEDVAATQATDVLLMPSDAVERIFPFPLEALESRRIGVFQRIGPADTLLGLQRSRQIAGMPFIVVREHALPDNRAYFKRILDLLYVLAAAPLLVVVGLAAALYVRVTAGPGILLRQERVGRFGVPFTLYKFRTMITDAEADTGAVLSSDDDPRIIPGLRWVRRTRMDEIPQFINVLKGQMSIVGPRPERPEFTAEFESVIPGYGRRHDIPPGITGLAQVQGAYDTDPMFKLGHDLQYLVNWSPLLDLEIIGQTVLTVLRGFPRSDS